MKKFRILTVVAIVAGITASVSIGFPAQASIPACTPTALLGKLVSQNVHPILRARSQTSTVVMKEYESGGVKVRWTYEKGYWIKKTKTFDARDRVLLKLQPTSLAMWIVLEDKDINGKVDRVYYILYGEEYTMNDPSMDDAQKIYEKELSRTSDACL